MFSKGPLFVKSCKPYQDRKEGSVLFNDALNTFYLWLYGVGHMVKDHSDSEKGNPLPPHRLLFPLAARVLLCAASNKQDITHHSLWYTSRGALGGPRNSSMGYQDRVYTDEETSYSDLVFL